MIKERILIANRGEIALRILRAARLLNLSPVIVHSAADQKTLPVLCADHSICIGPGPIAQSYLNGDAILEAAKISNSRYIHPGYGFLSENAHFATTVEREGFIFVGAQPESIDLMGNKSQARTFMQANGVPCIPGSRAYAQGDSFKDLLDEADHIGFPVLIKASGGGGGRGMQIVYDRIELESQVRTVQNYAEKTFKDSRVYLEKYLTHPRHIEVQILGDGYGKVVHIGLRECSIQRRYQKIIEEAQPVHLPMTIQEKMIATSLYACRQISYRGLGTLEFLYQDGQYYFIEMNTRVQVEHPVSEMISGLDLVQLQMQIALNEALTLNQNDIHFSGHAIECRINAEDPVKMTPSPGKIKMLHAPGGFGVRFDSHLYSGAEISSHYDSMVGKVITHGKNRMEAILKMRQALTECVFEGLMTNTSLHEKIFLEKDFIEGNYDTTYLATHCFF